MFEKENRKNCQESFPVNISQAWKPAFDNFTTGENGSMKSIFTFFSQILMGRCFTDFDIATSKERSFLHHESQKNNEMLSRYSTLRRVKQASHQNFS